MGLPASQRAIAGFRSGFGIRPRWLAQAPGRVNLIGEHTDYNQGHVLPVAIDRPVAVAVAPRPDATVRALALDLQENDRFPIEGIHPLPDGGWRNYVRGVAAVLRDAGQPLQGLDMAIAGDLPVAAGLASSAALEVAVLAAFAAAAELSLKPKEMALLAQEAENEFVGVACGIMDQLTAALARRDHALLIDCRNLEVTPVGLPFARAGLQLVIVDSALPRALADSPYNLRRKECQATAHLLGAAALRDITEVALAAARDHLPDVLYRRARHVVTEQARVAAAVEALQDNDLQAFGHLLYQSHLSLRDDFQVSCPELDLLVDLARGVDGVLGARLTGAGFGGCTLNLVGREALPAFRQQVVEAYRARTGLAATMYVCQAADGLMVAHVQGPPP